MQKKGFKFKFGFWISKLKFCCCFLFQTININHFSLSSSVSSFILLPLSLVDRGFEIDEGGGISNPFFLFIFWKLDTVSKEKNNRRRGYLEPSFCYLFFFEQTLWMIALLSSSLKTTKTFEQKKNRRGYLEPFPFFLFWMLALFV